MLGAQNRMPLKLSLKPGETLVVNGAVVQNGDRRGMLLLQNKARVLREKDLMTATAAQSPLQKAYFALMLYYLSSEEGGVPFERFNNAMREAVASEQGGEVRSALMEASAYVVAGKPYRALTVLRRLTSAGESHGGLE